MDFLAAAEANQARVCMMQDFVIESEFGTCFFTRSQLPGWSSTRYMFQCSAHATRSIYLKKLKSRGALIYLSSEKALYSLMTFYGCCSAEMIRAPRLYYSYSCKRRVDKRVTIMSSFWLQNVA